MLFGLNDYTSQSAIQLRPGVQNLALWSSESGSSKIQFVAFYQKAVGEQSGLAQYFLLGNKSEVTVKGDAVTTSDRDVRAEWLGLPDTYNGALMLNPQQKRFGGAICAQRRLEHYFKSKIWQHFWIGLQIDLESVEQQIGAQSVGAGVDDQLLVQFNRSELQYGKIGDAQTTSAGVSDVRLLLGVDYAGKHDLQLGLQSFLLVPGSWEQVVPEQLFTARRGFGKHVGFGFGAQVQIPLLSNRSRSELSGYLRSEVIGLLANQQLRVIDLKSKPWSRYLTLNKSDGSGNRPATTILTQMVRVDPYATGELMLGLQYKYRAFRAELSYGLWGHGSERIALVNDFVTSYGIAGSALNKSASASTIVAQGSDDTAFTVLQKLDLDLDSASARAAITHRINGQVGCVVQGKQVDLALNGGVFYELPQNNAMVKQWGSYLNFSFLF